MGVVVWLGGCGCLSDFLGGCGFLVMTPYFDDPLPIPVQVNYLGLLENVRVRRAGFANRQEYQRFVQR